MCMKEKKAAENSSVATHLKDHISLVFFSQGFDPQINHLQYLKARKEDQSKWSQTGSREHKLLLLIIMFSWPKIMEIGRQEGEGLTYYNCL